MSIKDSVNSWVNDHPTLVLVKRAAKEWADDDAPTMSAALAYYAILSIAPLIVIAIAVTALFYGPQAASGELARTLESVMGPGAAQAVQGLVAASAERTQQGLIASVIGVVALLFAASNVFAQLHAFMNRAWDVKEKAGGWKDKIMDRVLALGTVLIVGVLLLASLLLTAAVSAFGGRIAAAIPGGAIALQVVQLLLTIGIVTVLFAFLFRYLPDARVSWSDTWTGALITGILFAIGQAALGLYLTQSATASAYGAAGGIIVILLWAYYSSLIFFFGAEMTQVYANVKGDGIRPDKGGRVREGEEPSDENRPSRPGAGAGG